MRVCTVATKSVHANRQTHGCVISRTYQFYFVAAILIEIPSNTYSGCTTRKLLEKKSHKETQSMGM
jgi:hypothetical protein